MTNYEDVLAHLTFHKAILDDHEAGERITKYMGMVDAIEHGQFLAVRDPMEKAIAAAFELVLEQAYDPWDIDLGGFTKLYMEKVRDDGVVNFVTAGKLVAMAWSILKMQSEEVLGKATPPPPADWVFSDWELDYEAPERPSDFTTAVLQGAMPVDPAVRREGRRAVTLMELMEALDDAREEAARHMELAALREKARASAPKDFAAKMHGEDLNEDLAATWARLANANGNAVRVDSLANGDVWDRLTVFVAVLFLAKMEKVSLWQEDFPYGDIFVKRLTDEEALEPVPDPVPAKGVAA